MFVALARRPVGLAAAVLCVLAAACSSSGSTSESGPGGSTGDPAGGDGGAAADGPKSHALCPGAPTKAFPSDVGERCPMGSNRALCVSTTSSSCSNQLCLWDDTDPNASFGDSYCTVECTPGDATSCPVGFACKAQECSSGPANICVRTARQAPNPPCESLASSFEGLGFALRSFAVAKDGRIYVVASLSGQSGTAILSRAKGETTWTKIFEDASVTAESVRARAVSGLSTTVLPIDRTTFAIATGTDVKLASMPPCTDGANECAREFAYLFATPSGDTRGYVQSLSGTTWISAPIRPGTIELGKTIEENVSNLVTLPAGGFLAACTPPTTANQSLCTSTDGETVTMVTLPPNETFATSMVAAGESTDDFFYVGGSGKLHHKVKTEWLEEGVSGAPAKDGRFAYASLTRAADGTIFLTLDAPTEEEGIRRFEKYALTGDCWQPLAKDVNFAGVPLEGTTFVNMSTDSFCTYPVSTDP